MGGWRNELVLTSHRVPLAQKRTVSRMSSVPVVSTGRNHPDPRTPMGCEGTTLPSPSHSLILSEWGRGKVLGFWIILRGVISGT